MKDTDRPTIRHRMSKRSKAESIARQRVAVPDASVDASRSTYDNESEHPSVNRASEYPDSIAAIIDHLPVVCATFDNQGRCMFINQGARVLTGRPAEYYLGKTLEQVTAHPAEILRRCRSGISTVLESGARYDYEFSVPRANGTKHFLVSFFPKNVVDGKVVDVVALAMDISAHRETQESLRESDLRRDRFFAMLAHELRNPLSALRSGLKILEVARDGHQEHEIRSMMSRQLSHMIRLVNDLMDASRVSRGKLSFVREKIVVNDIINLALETSQDAIQVRHHTIHVVVPESSTEVVGDVHRLAQVVSNLLDNAAKYTPPGGIIQLLVSREEAEVVISVSDNGIGIDSEDVDRLFGLFSQLHTDLADSRTGLGIGLFLVKVITEAHGGTIAVSSNGKGKGASFTVRLPLAAAEKIATNNS